MSRIYLIRHAVDSHLDAPHTLLAMRLMFPPNRPEVDIVQELKDLYSYPERLQTGYRDEWRSIAIRALFGHAFSDRLLSDQENLDRYLNFLIGQAIPRCINDHKELFEILNDILAIVGSDNAISFPDPKRQALMKIIWPD